MAKTFRLRKRLCTLMGFCCVCSVSSRTNCVALPMSREVNALVNGSVPSYYMDYSTGHKKGVDQIAGQNPIYVYDVYTTNTGWIVNPSDPDPDLHALAYKLAIALGLPTWTPHPDPDTPRIAFIRTSDGALWQVACDYDWVSEGMWLTDQRQLFPHLDGQDWILGDDGNGSSYIRLRTNDPQGGIYVMKLDDRRELTRQLYPQLTKRIIYRLLFEFELKALFGAW